MSLFNCRTGQSQCTLSKTGESKLRSKTNSVVLKVAATFALLMTVTFFTTVQAQITTAIRGTVVDQQDKAVVDASVKITHTASGTVSLASSNENGVF